MIDADPATERSDALAAAWAMGQAEPWLVDPSGALGTRLRVGGWRGRRRAAAALACQQTVAALDALAGKGLLRSHPANPRPVWVPASSWGDNSAWHEEPEGGRLALGRCSAPFWPVKVASRGGSAPIESSPRSLRAKLAHWRLLLLTGLFGRGGISRAAVPAAKGLLELWLRRELALARSGSGVAEPLLAAYERGELGRAAPAPAVLGAPPAPGRRRL